MLIEDGRPWWTEAEHDLSAFERWIVQRRALFGLGVASLIGDARQSLWSRQNSDHRRRLGVGSIRSLGEHSFVTWARRRRVWGVLNSWRSPCAAMSGPRPAPSRLLRIRHVSGRHRRDAAHGARATARHRALRQHARRRCWGGISSTARCSTGSRESWRSFALLVLHVRAAIPGACARRCERGPFPSRFPEPASGDRASPRASQ